MKKLHWTDSEFDRTYFLLVLRSSCVPCKLFPKTLPVAIKFNKKNLQFWTYLPFARICKCKHIATTVISVDGQVCVRRPWTESRLVNDDSWVAALTVCRACLEHVGNAEPTVFTHTRQEGNTSLFRPIYCTASLLAHATYTTVRLTYWFFLKIRTFYGHATYTAERPIVQKIWYINTAKARLAMWLSRLA